MQTLRHRSLARLLQLPAGCLAFIGLLPIVLASPAQPNPPEPGFESLFNGKDLAGWDGEPGFWRVSDGAIEGAPAAPDGKIPGSTYLIWKGGKLRDFHLKLKTRIESGNSGIQYRSRVVHGYRVGGYQAEVSSGILGTGFLQQEMRRGIKPSVGQSAVNEEGGKGVVVGQVADTRWLLKEPYYKPGEWTDYDVIVRGNHHLHFVNGYPAVEYIERDVRDDKQQGRVDEGILAFQLHSGPYMKVQYRDIRLKHYSNKFGDAVRLFNDKDLAGWTVAGEGAKEAWGVAEEKGYKALRCKAGTGGNLQADREVASYVLRMQVRQGKAGDAAVLLGLTDADKVTRGIRVAVQAGQVGEPTALGGLPFKPAAPPPDAAKMSERSPGLWNDLELVLDDGKLEVYLNNRLRSAAVCETRGGRIALQAAGGEVEFRNVVLVPILQGKTER